MRSADVAVNNFVIAADWPTSAPVSMPRLTRFTSPRCTTSSTCASARSWRATGSSRSAAGRHDLQAAGVERAVGTLGEVVAPAHVGRPAADRVAFVREQRQRDGPAVVHLADDGVGREPHVVEELLAELERPVDLLDRVDLHALLVDLHDEHGEAAVLRRVPVGAGEAHRVRGRHRRRAPDLGAVHHPLVAVALGARQASGEVGTAGGLGEELHPLLLTAQHAAAGTSRSARACRSRRGSRRGC